MRQEGRCARHVLTALHEVATSRRPARRDAKLSNAGRRRGEVVPSMLGGKATGHVQPKAERAPEGLVRPLREAVSGRPQQDRRWQGATSQGIDEVGRGAAQGVQPPVTVRANRRSVRRDGSSPERPLRHLSCRSPRLADGAMACGSLSRQRQGARAAVRSVQPWPRTVPGQPGAPPCRSRLHRTSPVARPGRQSSVGSPNRKESAHASSH